jgi:hypothetical protein
MTRRDQLVERHSFVRRATSGPGPDTARRPTPYAVSADTASTPVIAAWPSVASSTGGNAQ